MSEREKRTHNSDADQSPERIKDPKAGLDRLRDALKHILKVPKEAILDDDGDARGETS